MQANSNTLYRSNIKSFPLSSSGKVRDIYNIDDKNLLIVTSDRLSAFDVILPDTIPGKGSVLTEVSNFWFERYFPHCDSFYVDSLFKSKASFRLPDR